MERRLTAILAADAVGYSKFMGTDEEAAFEALVERREIIDATIEEQEGRIFGSAGDSVIAEFSSSVKAARCAVEIQKQLGILNFQQSENRRMVFRVGVHTGDVIVKNGDLLGDGVNVAARIEGLAPAGGVAISAQVAEQIAGKPVARFERAGKHKLKNIARAREIWCWPPEAAETIRGHSRTWRIQMNDCDKSDGCDCRLRAWCRICERRRPSPRQGPASRSGLFDRSCGPIVRHRHQRRHRAVGDETRA